jgi:adenosylmethionine---8-amino-7-oxononanoate aminotransferase
MPSPLVCVPVESANGCTLTLSDGRRLIDGMSSWWACIHGYNHPFLNQAATLQISKMSHVMFGGLTHEPAVRLAQKLSTMMPSATTAHTTTSSSGDKRDVRRKLDKVFYCDSGSVSVEVAMKMAIQYWYNLHEHKRSTFLTIRGGYHGDTFAPMSVCDPVNGMHHLFATSLQKQLFCSRPTIPYGHDWDDAELNELRQLFEDHNESLAAVILEPIVQGAGGMRFYHSNYLRGVRDLCDEYGLLMIADEIATGFGRSGELFACNHADVVPDIICIGKALSGGFLSFAATITTSHVAQVFEQGPSGVLMHGPTFMGNPLACAVSHANLELLDSYDWKSTVRNIERQLLQELEPARDMPGVQDVRVLGAIGVVEMKESMDMKTVQPQIVEEGVWLRPFGKLLYTMPPFIIQPHELTKITRTMLSIASRRRM